MAKAAMEIFRLKMSGVDRRKARELRAEVVQKERVERERGSSHGRMRSVLGAVRGMFRRKV